MVSKTIKGNRKSKFHEFADRLSTQTDTLVDFTSRGGPNMIMSVLGTPEDSKYLQLEKSLFHHKNLIYVTKDHNFQFYESG